MRANYNHRLFFPVQLGEMGIRAIGHPFGLRLGSERANRHQSIRKLTCIGTQE